MDAKLFALLAAYEGKDFDCVVVGSLTTGNDAAMLEALLDLPSNPEPIPSVADWVDQGEGE